METDINLSSEITLRNGTTQYHYQIKHVSQLQTHYLIIGSSTLVVQTAFIVIKDETESILFEHLLQLLEMDKIRTTLFHPQSNALAGRMKKMFQNMLAKCVKE